MYDFGCVCLIWMYDVGILYLFIFVLNKNERIWTYISIPKYFTMKINKVIWVFLLHKQQKPVEN